MATRLYFSSQNNSAPISRALDTNWDDQVQWIASRALRPTANFYPAKPGDALTVTKDTGANTDVIAGQFTSDPLDGDQTISGTVSIVLRTNESVATADAFLQLVIRVVDERGGTVRGTLFAGQTQTSVVSTDDANNQEFATTQTTRIATVTLSSVAALDTDRLVIEVGARGVASGTGWTFAHRFGRDEGVADFALDAGLTTDLNPWIEFSQNLVFMDQGTATFGKVLAIGDSLQAGFNTDLQNELLGAFSGVICDALGGRMVWSPGVGAAFRTYAVLSFYRFVGASGSQFEPHTWVVQLGTNDVRSTSDTVHQGNINRLLGLIDEAPGPKRILWVNTTGDNVTGTGTPPGGTGGTFAAYNTKLTTTAAGRSDMEVLDWAAYAAAEGDASWWDNTDGLRIHMTALGYQKKREWLVERILRSREGAATRALNYLAGTTNLSDAAAANVYAGTTGLSLDGALNVAAGNPHPNQQWSATKAANALAGTSSLSLDEALNRLVRAEP
jgi:hypothetical protein